MSTVRTLEAEGFLELDDAALITRGPNGEVTVTPQLGTGTAGRSAVGATIGLVAGTLLGLPLLGALVGGGVGAKSQSTRPSKDWMACSTASVAESSRGRRCWRWPSEPSPTPRPLSIGFRSTATT